MNLSCATVVLAFVPFPFQGSAPAQAASADAFLIWKGRPWSLAEAAEQLPEVARSELSGWAPWCVEHEYRALLDEDAHAVLLASAKRRDLEAQQKRVHAVVEAVDRLAPRPERDPQESFLKPSWGLGQHVADASLATIVLLEAQADFDDALGHLAAVKPFLEGRLPREAKATFHSAEAATGALLVAPDGIETGTVWRPDNEIVNRLTRLLLHRRFGELPYWLDMGLAWQVEQGLQGGIYSFPGRDEFVSVGDHSGWGPELAREFKKRRNQPLRLEEVAFWTSAQWDGKAAAAAWGFTRYLASQPPATVAGILEDLRLDVKQHGVRTHADGTWELVAGYRTPWERQHAILAGRLGDDYLTVVSESFLRGKR
jgi:hypothetical protein